MDIWELNTEGMWEIWLNDFQEAFTLQLRNITETVRLDSRLVLDTSLDVPKLS
jgi:hypothetical protein